MASYNEGLTIGGFPHYHASLRTRRDKAAVVCGDQRITWGELSERVAKLANALSDEGLTRGQRVGVFLKNSPEYVELIYAIAGLGLTIVPMSYRFVERELVYAVNHSEVDALIVDADLVDVLDRASEGFEQLKPDRVFISGTSDHRGRSYEELVQSGASSKDYLVGDEWDLFLLAFTGGTTGFPKICEVPHRMAVQNWLAMSVEFGIGDRDTSLIAGPFYHGLGFFFGLQQLMVGGTIVVAREFDPVGVLEVIQREKVTFTPMAPTMYSMILGTAEIDQYDVSSVRGLVSAAAPLMTETKERLLDVFKGADLFEYYGATEAGFYSILKPKDQMRKIRCVGEPFWNCELKILDADGNELPQGEVGEIYKRGAVVGGKYLKDPEATSKMFRGAWITSGDMGYLDDEGFLYLVDRKNDMIISGGVNIFPGEIEEVITWMPDVVEVAIVGVSDDKWGESVKAYVVAVEGSDLEEQAIIDHCKEHLASFKKPRYVEFVDELPRNAAGKVLRRLLRNQG